MTHLDGTRNADSPVAVRVVFCGMTGQFSLLALEQLLWAGVSVVAIVLPALSERTGQLPQVPMPAAKPRGIALPLFATTAPRTILDLAAERAIPVLELGGRSTPETLAGLAGLAPDAICVACFSRRIPSSLLRLPRLGCLNVHPSLLPVHRGPDPLFWIFHDGDETGGVTIHRMDEGFDSGPILLREAIPFSDETTEAALERDCAIRGGALLAQALQALAGLSAGTLTPQPQDEAQASYQSWAADDDYTITAAWSARRSHRFLVGIVGRGEPIRFTAGDTTFVLREPLGYDAEAKLGAPWRLEGDALAVQCSPGILRCRVAGG